MSVISEISFVIESAYNELKCDNNTDKFLFFILAIREPYSSTLRSISN